MPKPKILGKESNGFNIIPSEKIYYDTYPYKVRIKNFVENADEDGNIIINWRRFHLAQDIIKHWSSSDLESRIRMSTPSYINNTFNVFLSTFNDYVKFINEWQAEIISVSGPINNRHRNILLSDTDISVRKKNYFNKYDTRMVYYPERFQQYREGFYKDVSSYLVENLKESRLQNTYRSYSVTIYTNKRDYKSIEAFAKLALPPHRLRMTNVYKYK